ncbi:MAG: sugar ABC transporter substrate-binding protein [Rhodobacterales bacterium]|nr:sugar ABC transporter substrate-binding protein [Rhodobacterales bacterium]
MKKSQILSSACLMVALAAPAFAQDPVTVAFAGAKLTDPFMVALTGMITEQAKSQNANLLAPTNANGDAAQQFNDIQTLLTKSPGAMIIAPVDGEAIVPAIKAANEAGVPVIVVDAAPTGGDIAMVIRADNYGMGVSACNEMGKRLGGKGTVLDLQGALTSTNARDRTNGFGECMAQKFPDIEVLQRPTDWDMAKATDALQIVVSTGELDGVYIASDYFLPGVAKVLQDANRWVPVGTEGHVTLIGIDGNPDALKAIRDGFQDATVSQPVDLYAQYSIHYSLTSAAKTDVAEGETDHGSIISRNEFGSLSDALPAPLVTKDNVDDPNLWGNH